ncbi:MAG: glycosyltransferase family 4 protein [Chitinispirillaceae bacterium]|nr:glycosyltransferase family 4 protein [Chitinispirillaceae bacterium]
MNILMLTYQGDMAGSTNSIAFLSRGLAEKGHTVVVGCRKESLLYTMLQDSGVIVEPMVFHGRFDLKNIRHVRDTVKKYSIELINAQSSYDRYSSILARFFYRLNTKVVHTRRQPPRSDGGLIQRLFYLAGTHKIVVISDMMKKIFVKKGYPASHLEVIYNGAPTERYSVINEKKTADLRMHFGISENEIVIGCISRFKKQEQLIQALKIINKPWKVLFAGIEKNSLDPLAAQLGIPNQILYAGYVDPQEILNYYKLLSVNVLPSTTDGFGLVLIEAMACGIPVIGTDFGGISDVIQHEISGLLFKDGDFKGLADSIERCINDSHLRERLIRNGRKRALEDFAIEKTIENYEKFYHRLISDGR